MRKWLPSGNLHRHLPHERGQNMKKILYKIIKINNKRIEKQKDNDKFLRSLCTSNNTLDINKYIRLISMVKNKYKK